MKRISISLNDKSINQAIKELKAYEKWVKEKTDLLIERLALIGAKEASVRFANAIYDGTNDVKIEVNPIENGWSITAKGQAVAFIEFGAGVYHNPSEPYPNPRPEGIVGIGEYGDGKGKRRAWYYKGEPGSNGEIQKNGVVKTRGNPAALGMWYATQEMLNEIQRIANEVFRNG